MKFRMMLSSLLLAAGVLFVNGCAKKAVDKEKKQATPVIEVCQKFFDSVRKCDFAAAAEFCDGEMKTDLEKKARELDGDAEKKALFEKNIRGVKLEFKSENVDKDFAAVEFVEVRDGVRRNDTQYLQKIDGKWKLVSHRDFRKAKKSAADKAKETTGNGK